ncbi:HNH endonuclease [Shewanella yunxiaonensis]|uniref:HNH endonuclease n=1 Tax=Shewanella yunxiaonensis TaxID=2829809 RepID=A0ABX7YRN1_9GAMM|nr:HNH endonuclease [Shewanella yunxiaonensis]QUN04796.1 HNH endonuclease [Shewanella yunxiaonensis]
MSFEYYLNKFQQLNTMRINGHNKPHKVCMLLAVMSLIEEELITENRIELNELLKKRFSVYFDRLKITGDVDSPENPFFHLRTEGFWHLRTHDGYQLDDLSRYSKNKIAYATLDEELFDYFRSSVSCIDLRLALSQNLTQLYELYTRWFESLGKSQKTIKNYWGAVKNTLSKIANNAGLSSQPLTEISSLYQYQHIVTPLRELAEFKQLDKKGNAMYSNALKSYASFLSDLSQVDVTDDVEQIWHDPTLKPTEKTTLVSARMGQGKFRERLFNLWHGCAVTNYRMPALLVASHIKPWRSSNNNERLDPFNGLLLVANLDKAFDKGLITFENSGEIIISSQLERPEMLGIKADMKLRNSGFNLDYMHYHREQVYQG